MMLFPLPVQLVIALSSLPPLVRGEAEVEFSFSRILR